MLYNPQIKIDHLTIGLDYPTCFVADIAANHDGNLNRAIDLIFKAKEAGADVAKFQHFKADTIVSDRGFRDLGKSDHQASWKQSVFEVYQKASVSLEWTNALVKACKEAGIVFMTSPYDEALIDYIDPFVPAYKVGSGDINWDSIICKMAQKGKPMMLACGASNLHEVSHAMSLVSEYTKDIILMQCNTNYTASLENFKYCQLNVLKTFAQKFPGVVLGLSDHTPGLATTLGAVALGARVIEKHFTDDNDREGPDHKFAMNPRSWAEMVNRTRELELALGTEEKKVEDNEAQTVVLQRRSVRLTEDLQQGTLLLPEHLTVLRPCPVGAIVPNELTLVLGKTLAHPKRKGESLEWKDLN